MGRWGWKDPRACTGDMGFPSKTPVSLMAQAGTTGGRSKGLEGKADS